MTELASQADQRAGSSESMAGQAQQKVQEAQGECAVRSRAACATRSTPGRRTPASR